MWNDFKNYLIIVGERSVDFTYSHKTLFDNKEWFKECFNKRISPYYALTMLDNEQETEKSLELPSTSF